MPEADARAELYRALASRLGAHRRIPDFIIKPDANPLAADDLGRAANQDLVETFIANAQRSLATVKRVQSADEAPMALREFLLAEELPLRVHMGADALLRRSPWPESGVMPVFDAPIAEGACVFSHAVAGVAEMGAVAMTGGPDNPTSFNFLADRHVVLVGEEDLAASLEVFWRALRQRFAGKMPRCVNLIAGPSRSADIEQTLLLGAHGPRRLHILLVAEESA